MKTSATRTLVCLCISGMLAAVSAEAESNVNTNNRWAWSASVGWINCNTDPTNGAVIGEFVLSGWLYNESCGWIHLGNGEPTNGIHYTNVSSNDYGVNHDSTGNLEGYAWCASAGWITFETNTGKPTVDLETGVFNGYAWGGSLGWIGFSNMHGYVQANSFDKGPDDDTDGIPDIWERIETGGTNSLGGGPDEDFDGDTVSDSNEYLAGTDPTNKNDYLHITSIDLNSVTNPKITWASEASRMYRIEMDDDLVQPGGWLDSGLGLQGPDSGSGTTTRDLPSGFDTQAFIRVKAVVPLSE
jgi:hypothetical protein